MAYSGEMEPAVAIAAAAAEAATDDRTRARALTLVGTVMQFVDPVGSEPGLLEADGAGRTRGRRLVPRRSAAGARLLPHDARRPGRRDGRRRRRPARARPPRARAAAGVGRGHPRRDRGAAGRFAEAEAQGAEGARLAVAVGEPVSAMGALHPLSARSSPPGKWTRPARSSPSTGSSSPPTRVWVARVRGARRAAWRRPRDRRRPRGRGVRAQRPREACRRVAAEAAACSPGATAARATPTAHGARRGHRRRWSGGARPRGLACRLRRSSGGRGSGSARAIRRGRARRAGRGGGAGVAAGRRGRARPAGGAHAGGRASAPRAWRGRPPRCGPSWAVASRRWAGGGSWSRPTRGEGARLGRERAVEYAARSRGRRARPSRGGRASRRRRARSSRSRRRGCPTPRSARSCWSASGTVRTHLRSVFAKLGVTSRAELAAQARRGL